MLSAIRILLTLLCAGMSIQYALAQNPNDEGRGSSSSFDKLVDVGGGRRLHIVKEVRTTGLRSEKGTLQVTRNLPTIDRIELQKVRAAEMWIKSVEGTKIVEGHEAQTIARLWRSQKFGAMGANCHFPVYAIKFFRKGKLVAYASLCWECRNIMFIEPDLDSSVGFNARGRRGRELFEVFTKAFPGGVNASP